MKARMTKPLLTLSIVLVTLSSWHANPLMAAVPPSVAIRQQPAAVEDVIKQLETKAAAAQGTWSTHSGPLNSPGTPWDCGINGQQWFLRSTAAASAPQAGALLYFDGEDGYQLPDAVHLQMDGVLLGKNLDLRMGRQLLLAMWCPRLFLGSLANGTAAPVTISGVNYIAITADPRNDEIAKKDTAIYKKSSIPILVFLYDPAKKAFTSLKCDDRHGHQFITTVNAWDNFGTAETWPSQLTVQTISSVPPAAGTEPVDLSDKVLLQVDKFTAGKDSFFDTAKSQVTGTPFFASIGEDCRSVEFLQAQQKLQPDNLTVQVDLAQTQFLMNDLTGGLQNWNTVSAKLNNPQQQLLIQKVLATPAAAAMRFKIGRGESLADCVAFMDRLTTTLPDDQFALASYHIAKGWQNLHKGTNAPPTFQAISPRVLDRLVKAGKDDAVELLIAVAKASPSDAALIDPLLIAQASAPMPASGYPGSRLSLMVNSALRAGDVERAQGFLAHVDWPAGSADEAKQDAALVLQAAQQTVALEGGQLNGIAAVLDLNQQFADRFKAKDHFTFRDVGKALVQAASKAVGTALEHGEAQSKVIPVLMAMPVKPEASTFWDNVLKTWLLAHVSVSGSTIQRLGPVVTAYSQHFILPDYESTFWMNAWTTSRDAAFGDAIRYLNKALAAAPTEDLKAEAVRKLIRECLKKTEFDLALQIDDGTAGMIHDPALVAQIKELTDSVKTAKADATAAQIAKASSADKARIQSQLVMTKANLEKARAQGRDADVKRWEQAVADLSKLAEQNP